jgi:hypothetical protein
MRTHLLLPALLLLGLTGAAGAADDPWAARRAKLDERPKKIFAHYMGCFPIGRHGIAPGYTRGKAKDLRHSSPSFEHAFGGMVRGVPLLPDGVDNLTLEAAVDLDMRRAMRAGIDGFAYMAIAGGKENVFPVMDAMFKVAEEKNYPFEITWCLSGWDKSLEAIEYLLAKHGTSPKLARRDGKVLLLGYQSVFSSLDSAKRVFAERHPERKDLDWVASDLRMTPEGLRLLREGYRDLERRFNTPMYFQFGFGALFHGMKGKPAVEMSWPEITGVLAEEFDALTAFHVQSGPEDYDAVARAVTGVGAEWGEPVMYQYENLLWSGYRTRSFPLVPGGNAIRERWERARANGSTLIQFTTWNDYHEATSLAPTTDTRYAFLDLTAYFVQWWKSGTAPTPARDKLYLLYPKYRHELPTYPFRNRAPWRDTEAMNRLEVLTLLTAPARVQLPGRAEAWEAPAGLSWRQVPLTPGPVTAEVVRGGKTVVRLESPEPVTDRPFREQHSLVGVSSEDLRHWREDFGETAPAPLQRGEYGDLDGDGLPNWFELYWFGQSLLDWTAAGVAEAGADPDGDGRTNLQEYQAQSNPRVANLYPKEYVWNFLEPSRAVYAFNPEYDDRDVPVWHYLQKYGVELPITRDGAYWPCERFGWYPGTPQTRAVFAPPYNTPADWAATGDFTWRWTTVEANGARRTTPEFVMSTGSHAVRALAWQSPVAGRVRMEVTARLAAGASNPKAPATLAIEHSRPFREVSKVEFSGPDPFTLEAREIDVARGDRLYLVLSPEPGRARQVPLTFDRLTVTLLEEGQ